jgi:adenosine deaminase
MGYEGVTLDYVYAFISWDLDIADLKKLCLNSLKYAGISEEEKVPIKELFNYKWGRFLEFVMSKF